MIQQTDIQHVDGWRLQVSVTGNDVEQAAVIVHWDRHVTQQTVSSQHICELHRLWVVEADVEVADEEHWVYVHHYTFKYV